MDTSNRARENPKPPAPAKHGGGGGMGGNSGSVMIGSRVPGMQDFPLYTPSGNGSLYVPDRMTPQAFALLKKQIENSLAIIEATAVSEKTAD